MRVQRIERLQRIIVIQGVSLVRILNHPSLDRLVGRDSKYPLTQSVSRENLSGCHLAPRGLRPLGARWHPSRFSLPLSFVCGYSRISPFLTLSFGEDLWILTRSPPSIIVILGGERVSIREYPRSKEGGRENLEGESRGSAAHERFSREILPTDRLSEGIFRILTSETPVYY